jgi:hypothetical protein
MVQVVISLDNTFESKLGENKNKQNLVHHCRYKIADLCVMELSQDFFHPETATMI